MAANLISTSTSASALANTIGAKVIVAADGTALVIYYDGTSMVFRTAASPYSTWSSATTLPSSGGNRYGAAVHYNSGDDSVDVVYHTSTGAITYVKLTKSGSSYSAGSAVQIATGGTGSSGEAVWIGKDSSARLWAVSLQTNTTWQAHYSTDGGSTWTASITSASTTGNGVDQPCAAVTGNYLLVCYSKNNGAVAWRRLDTTGTLTAWSAEQTANVGTNPDFYTGDFMSMATDGSGRVVLLVSSQGFNFGAGVWAKVYTPGTDSWGTDTHIGATVSASFGDNYAVAVSNGTDVWAIFCHGIAASNYQLVFKKWSNSGASWDGSATQLEASGNNITFPQGFASSSTLLFAYVQGTASPWSLYFDSLSTASHVSHTSSGSLANVKKTTPHTASGALAQLKRFGVTRTASGALAQVTRGQQHTASGALAQVQSHPKRTAAAAVATVRAHATRTSSKAAAHIAKIPPLAPVISRSQPAYASDNTYPPSNANDGAYGTFWTTAAAPSGVSPAIWAVDLSGVPAAQRHQVVLAWYSESADGYWTPSGGYNNQPRDYTIETNTAAGGAYPPGGVWTPIVTVTGNVYWAREHAFDLAGANWVRIVVTASNGVAPNNGVSFQLDIHDAHRGDRDDWLLLGDSIMAEVAGRRNIDGNAWTNGPIAQQANASNGIYFPVMLDGGNGGMTMAWAASNIASLLSGFGGHYVSIGYGTNDLNQAFQMPLSQLAAVYANLLTVLDAIVAAGKKPIVPYVPYGTNNSGYIGINAQAFNAYVDLHLPADRSGQYLRGPDLYRAFYANQGLLRDGIHPTYAANANGTQTGYDLYQRVWRDWLLATIYATPHQSHVSAGALAYITRASGAIHTYHTSTGAQAVVAYPTHHQSSGALAQVKQHPKRTAAAALVQVKQHNSHTANASVVNILRHVSHMSAGSFAYLKSHPIHTAAAAVANIKQHASHTSAGALAQISQAGHATHPASGVLVQVKRLSVKHTASGALASIKSHPTHTSPGALAQVKAHTAHAASGVLATVKQHASRTASGALAQTKQHSRHSAAAALAHTKAHVGHPSIGALATVKAHTSHTSNGALAQLTTVGHATHPASGALANIRQHPKRTSAGALASVKAHTSHTSNAAVVSVKRRGITHPSSSALVHVTHSPVHQSSGSLAQLRAHLARNAVGALVQVKRRSIQHTAKGVLAQIALPPAPVATGVSLVLPPIARSPIEL